MGDSKKLNSQNSSINNVFTTQTDFLTLEKSLRMRKSTSRKGFRVNSNSGRSKPRAGKTHLKYKKQTYKSLLSGKPKPDDQKVNKKRVQKNFQVRHKR